MDDEVTFVYLRRSVVLSLADAKDIQAALGTVGSLAARRVIGKLKQGKEKTLEVADEDERQVLIQVLTNRDDLSEAQARLLEMLERAIPQD